MKGTRPLDNDEIRRVSAAFTGIFATRNRGLFMLGVSTGGRISELLSLRVGDVYQNGTAVTDLLYDKSRQTSESFQFIGAELKETADETLFLELALRGYDLSSLRENNETENKTAAEIVKIG